MCCLPWNQFFRFRQLRPLAVRIAVGPSFEFVAAVNHDFRRAAAGANHLRLHGYRAANKFIGLPDLA